MQFRAYGIFDETMLSAFSFSGDEVRFYYFHGYYIFTVYVNSDLI